MEKRVIVAAALSVLILLGWSYFFPPPKPQPRVPVETAPADLSEPQRETATVASDAPGDEPSTGVDEQARIAATAPEEIFFETRLYELVLLNQGARAVSWKLREYTRTDGQPLELLPQFPPQLPLMLSVELDDPEIARSLNEALYQVERHRVPAEDGLERGEQIRFTWADGLGLEAVKSLTFREGSYLVDVELEVTDRGRRLPARIAFGPGFGSEEPTPENCRYPCYKSYAVLHNGESVRRMKTGELVDEPQRFSASVQWAGMEDQYFAALLLPGNDPVEIGWRSLERTRNVVDGDTPSSEEVEEPLFSVRVPSTGATLFVGPKKFTLLHGLGHDLDRVIWFSRNPMLAWVSRGIFRGLLWIHAHTIQNYGLAILLSTFLLRVLPFPVNQYAMVSMKKTQLQMQKLQPKIKAIKNKYKKDKSAEARSKMNQETMELYKTEGVNPMGGVTGCLPMLAQFPILIGFYNMLTVAVELRGAPFFGWITDLSAKDPYWIIPLMMGVTMFMQQKMAMSKVKDPVQQQQQKFMMIMPFVFAWICLQMPSGMVLYWLMNNVLGMGQQWLVNRQTSQLETAEQKA